jgi:glutathione synthase/RimK-type ligase-like ATP-grasp enzyme
MQKVLILFGRSNWKKSKPFANKDYQYSYEYFYALCKKNGIQMYRASYEWYDYEKNVFKYAWIFRGKNGKWEKVFNIKPNLIYDKTKARSEVYYRKELIGKYYPFINNLNFTQLIDDKLTCSLLFPLWSKKSWLVKSTQDAKKILRNIETARVVLKPLLESGGNGIHIIEKKDLDKLPEIKTPYLVQEFIDSSRGVPGASQSLHDLRLVFVNQTLLYSYITEPKSGSYLANLAQGGSLKIVSRKNIPQSISPLVKYVHKTLSTFDPKIYSIDFMFDENKRPWIVELNSMPGLYFTPKEKPYMLKMYAELLRVFKKRLS